MSRVWSVREVGAVLAVVAVTSLTAGSAVAQSGSHRAAEASSAAAGAPPASPRASSLARSRVRARAPSRWDPPREPGRFGPLGRAVARLARVSIRVGRAYDPRHMRVLIVEDDGDTAAAVARGLRREGLAVDVARDGREGLAKAGLVDYDVVVLDRDLPVVHGDEVCRRLSALDAPPAVLMLTAASEVGDRVGGLAIGADDYLGKPFAFAELVARVLALGRRVTRPRRPVLSVADVELDSARRRVRRGGRELRLTAKELGVLEALMVADGSVMSAEELLARVWDENADPFSAAVRVTMSSLRRRLGDPPLIETLPGQGYRIGAFG